MRTFKHLLLSDRNNLVISGLCGLIVAMVLAISPSINQVQAAAATISEEMGTIPAEVLADWKDQDGSNTASVIDAVKKAYPDFASKITGTGDEGYKQACHYRRVGRMKPYADKLANIMFCRHHNFGGILVGYHDNAQSGESDNDWAAKGALCVINFKNYYSTFTELLTKTDAVVRDPCVSFDGKKVLIAISGKSKGTGYKIYEMEIESKKLTALTAEPDGIGTVVADFEPCYLPNGDIMFTSTRNFGIIDCAFNPATNMFIMNGAGKCMRQVGFDQVSTFYPVMQEDGTVMYTRWEYNDRDLTNAMGIFVMNPDGSHQTEWFGNQTPWPYTQIHARPIPGTRGAKAICVAGGHHGPYSGELMIVDRSLGANGKQSVKMIAPLRDTKPDVSKSDISMGNVNFIAQTPYPLDEKNFLVSWRKSESVKQYRLFFMNIDGTRELLAWSDQSVSQPVLLKAADAIPPKVARQSNWRDSLASFTMQDVYVGGGMEGVAKGTAKTLRVVRLHYRAAGGTTGMGMGSAPSGAFTPAITCPISTYGASWECKEVLGETKIFPDGSASFIVPARVPVFFQVLDSMGYCIATMRSWATLMPGEQFACTGCHENKITTPPPSGVGQCGNPKALDKPLGIENKRFDFNQLVQPIFTAKCVSCHKSGHASGFDLSGDLSGSSASKKWAKSYQSLTSGIGAKSSNKAINIGTIFQQPDQQKPYSFGSSKSGIMLTGGMSGSHQKVQVTDIERKIVACWIDLCAPHAGKYNSYLSASDSSSYQTKLDRRVKWAAIEKKNIEEMLAGVDIADQQNSIKAARSAVAQLNIGYVPAKRALVLKQMSQGNLRIMDLRGRVLYCTKVAKHADGEVSVSLPAPLGMGLYVAKFEGVSGIQQAKISISE